MTSDQNRDGRDAELREILHAWIRSEAVPVGMKLMMGPKVIQALLDRLAAQRAEHEQAMRAVREQSPDDQDDRFARELKEAQRIAGTNGSMEPYARVLSGRLRQMDKRAKGANKRADALQADLAAALAQAERAERERDEALEALRPFADEAETWAETVADDHRSLCTEPGCEHAHPGSETTFNVGHLRRARAVLARPRPDDAEENSHG